MQPINRVILLLLLAGAGVYYLMRQQSKGEYDRQVGALAATLDRRYLSTTTPAAQAEAMFLRALVIYSDYRSLVARGRISIGEDVYLKEALSSAGYTADSEIGVTAKSLRDSLNLVQQMKIITEPDGAQALLTGQSPVIRAGSFKGDTLVVGRRVHPVLAPGLANHPANYALLPSNAAALFWPHTLSDATISAINDFKAHGLLDAKTALDLKQRADQLKTLKSS